MEIESAKTGLPENNLVEDPALWCCDLLKGPKAIAASQTD
jgi:hypothetical protein